jgi:hypothetical protein
VSSSRLPFLLGEHDHVVTAFAQRASGPGWSNTPLWVIIQDGDGKLRRECLQPDEQSHTMMLLYNLSNSLNSQLTAEVENVLGEAVRAERAAKKRAKKKASKKRGSKRR